MNAIRRVSQSSFFRGVIAIAGGTALAQAVGVLLSPLLTRLYTPEAVGLWGLFMSFLGVTSVAATLRYEVAIVAAASEEDALVLTRSSLVLALLTSFLGALVLEFLRRKDLFGYGSLPAWASLLAFLALLASAWGLVLRYYSVRKGAFGLVGRFTVTQGIARPVAQVLFSFTGGGGLLLGDVTGRFLGLLSLWRILPSTSGLWLSPRVLVKFRSYPLVQLPSGVIDTFALMALIPVFTALYGPATGGHLALGQRVVGLPLNLIGAAIADVFYSRASDLVRKCPKTLRSFLIVTAFRMALVSVPLGLTLWFIAPRVVPWVFGSEWGETGEMVAALAPWFAAQLVVSPLSRIVFLSRYGWLKLPYDMLSVVVISSPLFFSFDNSVSALAVVSWAKTGQLGLYLLLIVLITRPDCLLNN